MLTETEFRILQLDFDEAIRQKEAARAEEECLQATRAQQQAMATPDQDVMIIEESSLSALSSEMTVPQSSEIVELEEQKTEEQSAKKRQKNERRRAAVKEKRHRKYISQMDPAKRQRLEMERGGPEVMQRIEALLNKATEAMENEKRQAGHDRVDDTENTAP